MGRDGFEPSKQVAADLQSVPFGHSESAHVFNYDTCIVYHNRCDYASIFYRNQIIFFNTWIACLGRYFGGGLMPSLSLRYAAKSL